MTLCYLSLQGKQHWCILNTFCSIPIFILHRRTELHQ